MSNLAMKVTGLPPGLRATQVDDPHVPAVTALLTAKEMAFFGRSDSNDKETLGALRAPELHGARGTTAVWQDQELIAVLLAYEDFERCRDLYLDMFIHPLAAHRQELASALLAAAAAYAREYDVPPQAWLKMESFHGDEQIEAALHAAGYRTHRVYQRMRLDFAAPPASPTPPAGVTVRTMREEDWHDMYEVVQSSFLDHYDFHPRTFEVFKRDALDETSDPGQWRLAFDGGTCIGVCMGSNRYAAHRLGYVETLGVLRAYRRRGVAQFLLRDAFHRDAALGFAGTSLHCDATNPTGATQLYEGLGLRRDQAYNAWRIELPTRVATASGR
ncbi:MAG: GNAT family N-acetyltransferase [Actinobacteria bacterium]|nr:GNAT family N-acetyltransferase [Actinomycetota bacterium]MCB8998331.1 GNAT family N-acetyltransferase [Actinomycetota bacterium]MCB9415456.1 GNAT family N-acetyltransferase [Actinomycetota bacterium]HRY10965.1 GNAT family N-acetyltransferase [Candidatus Nanopelagicales bacterium]